MKKGIIFSYGFILNKLIILTISIIILSLSFQLPISLSLQDEDLEVYLYKIVIESDSDWTTIDITEGPLVVDYNATLVQGSGAPDLRYIVTPTYTWVSKKPSDTTPIRIDIEIIALKRSDANVIVRKGDIGNTKISLYAWENGNYLLLWSAINKGVNTQYPGTNDRIFHIYSEQLYKKPIGIALYENIAKEIGKKIFAFYYPWYGTPNGPSKGWFHWEGVSQDNITNSAHYPLLGIYDSQDEKLIETHILLASYAGIDGFIVSWWGINSFEDESLEKIIKIAEKYDFKITIYYESYRPWKPLTIKEIVSELSYIVKKYSLSPAFFKINGKPVFFIYNIGGHERKPDFWLQVKRSLEKEVGTIYLIGDTRNPEYLHVFEGFHTYIELNRENMKNTYIFYNTNMRIGLAGLDYSDAIENIKNGSPIKIQEKILFYTIVPGYDDRKIRIPGNFLDRINGDTYRKFWNDALENKAEHILITSWNELHEGTEIESTREYGFLFLNITRNYANKFKEERIEKAKSPNLDLKLIFNEEKNEILLKIKNIGMGVSIANTIQLQYPSGIEIYVENMHCQPSKENFIILIVPIIKEQEEYAFSLRFKGSPPNKLYLKTAYYSIIGSTYYSDTSLSIIMKTYTTTLTNTKIETTTLVTMFTKELTQTTTLTTAIITTQTITPQSIIFVLAGSTIILIILLIILGYVLKRKTKRL